MHDKDADCLLNGKEIGKKEIETFIEERLKSEDRNIFWNKQSKLNLPTFNSTKNIGKTTSKNSKFTIQIDQNLFQRLLVVSQTRSIDMEHVLSFELNAVPLSITHFDGEMRKTCKSKILHELEMDEKIV